MRSFPYAAEAVMYVPPSSADVAEKVGDGERKSHLARNGSVVQRRGYTSDEELEELESPLTSIIDKLPSSPTIAHREEANLKQKDSHNATNNARYQLLRQVWAL